MLTEKKLIHLLDRLSKDEECATITIGDFDIHMRVFDLSSKVSLQTSVYHGDNYIPKSVRQTLSQKISPLPNELSTYLTIDEKHFGVILNYLGVLSSKNKTNIKWLLEEFSIIAENWRGYLDEQDRNDLVHIPVK
jgi:hypothetical protein